MAGKGEDVVERNMKRRATLHDERQKRESMLFGYFTRQRGNREAACLSECYG